MRAGAAAILSAIASTMVTAQILHATGGTLDGRALVAAIMCPLVIAFPASAWQFWQHERLKEARNRATDMHRQLDEMHRSLVDAHNALAERARRDPMTGSLNREAFFNDMAEARQTRGPSALLVIDIDHFKLVNDIHGHLTGDRAIRQVARIIAESLDPDHMLGRIGGEEFGVYLPQADSSGAVELGERICKAVEASRVRADTDESLPLTVSIGGAFDPAGSMDIESLYRQADRTLYEAKNDGRNRALFSSRPDEAAA